MHRYLSGPGRNAAFTEGLRRVPRRWHGPVKVPLAALERTCGPEPEIAFRVPRSLWCARVAALLAGAAPIEAYPPLIVRYEDGRLEISDGNHRHAAFVLRGLRSAWAILWYPDARQHAHHEERGYALGR